MIRSVNPSLDRYQTPLLPTLASISSAPAAIQFGAKADAVQLKTNVATKSLLDLSPLQQGYVNELKGMLAPYGVNEVQFWDENKRPPVELLKAFTDKGLFVSGVPIPEMAKAKDLLNNPDVQKWITPEAQAKLNSLVTPSAEVQKQLEYLKSIGKEGFTKSMLMASMEIPKKTSVGVATFLGVNTGLAAQSISKIGTPEQQALWLNALNQGTFTYGFGLTEEKVGSNPRDIQTTFKKETDPVSGKTVYRLNGNKKFIGNAARVLDKDGKVIHRGADFLVIYAVDDANKPPADRSFRAFMVPRSAIGEENIWHTGGENNKLGLREVNNGNFNIKDVVIPEELMLGKPDECIYKKLLGLLDITRLFVGAMSLGSAEASLETAAAYSTKRYQNGGMINQFQAVTFPLRVLEAKASAAKLLLMEGARLVDLAASQKEALEAGMQAPLKTMDEVTKKLANAAREVKTSSPEVTGLFIEAINNLGSASEKLSEESKVKDAKKGLIAAKKALDAAKAKLSKQLKANIKDVQVGNALTLVNDVSKQLDEALGQVSKLVEPIRFGLETAMGKLMCSELAFDSADQAMMTLGGNGFMENPAEGLGLPKRLRDAWVTRTYEGTRAVNKNIIAQGAFIGELKKFSENVQMGLRYYLLKTGFTKRIRYRLLKDMARTPMDRVNAAYQFATADGLSKYNGALNKIKADWAKNGVPEKYKDWDKKSVEREQNLLASVPVQGRMQLIADMAVYKKMMELSLDHLKVLAQKPSLTPDEQKMKKDLQLFEKVAEDAVISLGRQLGSSTTKQLEEDHNG